MDNTGNMKMAPGMARNLRVPLGSSFSPAEIHAKRFLLYAMTFLLCTPSDLAGVVERGEDVDMWLRNAGIDPKKPCSRTRNMCIEYINKIKQHPTAYLLMAPVHHALRTLMISSTGIYNGIGCPTFSDSKAMLNRMIDLCENNGSTTPKHTA